MDLQMRRGLGLTMGLGFGIGLTVAGLLMAGNGGQPVMPPDEKVRERAQALGMVDPTVLPQPQPAPRVIREQEYYLVVTEATTWVKAAALLKEAGLVADEAAVLELAKARGLEQKAVPAGLYRTRPSLTPTEAVDLFERGPGR